MTRSLEMAGSRRLAGTFILSLVVGLALLSPATAQPMPKIGDCPSGDHHSGGYCAPSSTLGQRLRRPASARAGTTRAAAIVSGRKALATPCIGSAHARWVPCERRVLPFEPVEPIA